LKLPLEVHNQDHNGERQDPCETLNDLAYNTFNKDKYHSVEDKDPQKQADLLKEVENHP